MTHLKKIIVTVLIFTIFIPISYTQVKIDLDIKVDTVRTAKYKPFKSKEKQIFLRMNCGSYFITNGKELRKIKGKTIDKIQLVYTKYPKDADMSSLNKKRLLSLYMKASELFYDSKIKWEFVEQTGADRNSIYNYFHGFVITYRKTPLWSAVTEKKYFEDIISGKSVLKDSSILKVFNRNKWDNLLIVCDMTGSMSPYIGEVMLWHHLNMKKHKNSAFVFFNDGNKTPTVKKKIGSTGGIYCTNTNDIDSLINVIVKTVEGGDGGDADENDIEALLFAIKKYPDKKNIILIADNYSKMRDYELIKKLKKPVKVILCGTVSKINTEYLDLVLESKGSIHTIEEDIINLMKLTEGATISIGDETFKIEKGKFLLINKSSSP